MTVALALVWGGSRFEPEAVAVSVAEPVPVAIAESVIVAVAPFGRVPIEHVTGALPVQLPRVVVAFRSESCDGSVSLTDTSVASIGPWSVTEIVKLTVECWLTVVGEAVFETASVAVEGGGGGSFGSVWNVMSAPKFASPSDATAA